MCDKHINKLVESITQHVQQQIYITLGAEKTMKRYKHLFSHTRRNICFTKTMKWLTKMLSKQEKEVCFDWVFTGAFNKTVLPLNEQEYKAHLQNNIVPEEERNRNLTKH